MRTAEFLKVKQRKSCSLRLICSVKLPLPGKGCACRMRIGDGKGAVRWAENICHLDTDMWINVKPGIRFRGL